VSAAKPLLYFLCTGNSCRSQMAEGFARALAGARLEVASAGLEPSAVHPLAIAVMREAGVDISGHRSKAIDPALLARAAIIVTLCGDARDRCPAVGGPGRRLHWDLPDPARAPGGQAERLAAFRAVRDDIRRRVAALLQAEGGL
jgi:arsenate reductase